MMLVTPEKIASVMALFPLPHSFAELDDLVTQGLPKHALKASVDRVCLSGEDRRKLLYRIIPEATYKRRRVSLSADESEKAERLARIFATTEFVWNSEADARQFLNTPHPMLQGRTPLDVSMSELGARRVEELLWKLFYGIAA
jgi:putative toxin-antitoxin system antitoxin component (TIGR02293 family)